MTQVTHKTQWRDLTPHERHGRVCRSVESTEAFVRRTRRQEQREQQALRWCIAVWLLLLAGLGWLAFTPSGRAFLHWVDAL